MRLFCERKTVFFPKMCKQAALTSMRFSCFYIQYPRSLKRKIQYFQNLKGETTVQVTWNDFDL